MVCLRASGSFPRRRERRKSDVWAKAAHIPMDARAQHVIFGRVPCDPASIADAAGIRSARGHGHGRRIARSTDSCRRRSTGPVIPKSCERGEWRGRRCAARALHRARRCEPRASRARERTHCWPVDRRGRRNCACGGHRFRVLQVPCRDVVGRPWWTKKARRATSCSGCLFRLTRAIGPLVVVRPKEQR